MLILEGWRPLRFQEGLAALSGRDEARAWSQKPECGPGGRGRVGQKWQDRAPYRQPPE